MSTKRLVTTSFIALLCSVAVITFGQSEDNLTLALERRDEPYVPLLCPLLENLRRGDRVDVVVSGIYRVGPESSVLFDPNTPLCDLDVQPTVWVDFDKDVKSPQLDHLLDKYHYAAVTLRGRLEGPRPHGPERPNLPLWMEFADRFLGRRYGHLNGYRARLQVTEVMDVWKAPAHQALSYVRHRPQFPRPPEVESTMVPYYPPRAQSVGLSGNVSFQIEVEKGVIQKISHINGDPVLAQGAQKVIESWTFDPAFTGRFSSNFIFRLEERRTGEDPTPIVRMRLPSEVEIIAPLNLW